MTSEPQLIEEKKRRPIKWIILTVLLCSIIGFESFYILQIESQYSDLYRDYQLAQEQMSDLTNWYDWLCNYVNVRSNPTPDNLKSFVTPNYYTVIRRMSEITGGRSDLTDWQEFWGDVRAMYDWVVSNIRYEGDSPHLVLPPILSSDSVSWRSEFFKYPCETLEDMCGDCEDQAILLCSLIRAYTNEEYPCEVINIIGSKGGHCGVQMLVSGDLLVILDPAGHYFTHIGDGIQKEIDCKPISTAINEWLDHLKPALGSDVKVKLVFSDELYKSFSSTQEYIQWAEDRY